MNNDHDRLRQLRDNEETRRIWTGIGCALAIVTPLWAAIAFVLLIKLGVIA
jgi:hypothetical protein